VTTRQTQSLFSLPAADDGAVARRAFDILFAGTAAVLLAPLMLAIAIAIWVETGRPILFSHDRLGRGGRPFRMYKFRKFNTSADRNRCPLTIDGDRRLTAAGRILVASKLDELPQLWNVLRGEMSIVGPRPESLAFADCFRDGFEKVLEHKPGLVGPNQILFRHEGRLYPANVDPTEFYRQVLFPTKAKIDLGYYPHRTFYSDLRWILRAVLAISGWTQPSGLRPATPSKMGGGCRAMLDG
jgi:lipopolysaccharide/colanic/teichoic acid biosynthesis glycosyltransferase